jgi:hypothetical protein
VSPRKHKAGDLGPRSVEKFLAELVEEVEKKQ